jgi:uncharacterized NAD(P)/FAD-binding protein YdhS
MTFHEIAESATPKQKGPGMLGVPLFTESQSRVATSPRRPIAVIGAGFSGTIATLHLLNRLPPDQPILLCERAPAFGRGVAYATDDNDHLLNVRAANMSALADEPLHFQDWITRRATGGSHQPQGLHHTSAGVFASRNLYGLYLRSILDSAMRETAGQARLRLFPDEVTDVVSCGEGYEIVGSDGQRLEVAKVVLAVGNLPAEESDDPHICNYAWGDKAQRPLTSDLPVLIVGTGLTMVDIAISLRRRNFTGGIYALSRGGLLPMRHAISKPWPTPNFSASEEISIRALTARVRAEARRAKEQGIDWRAVIDGLRPITARLWSRLPAAERARFLRHVRRAWDVHRHRMAPPHADVIDAMVADGSLTVAAGRIRRMESGPDSVRVTYAARDGSGEKTIEVQRIIMANGLEHISRTQDPLMKRMLERGLVRLDPQGLGIDATEGLNAVRADGSVADNIWALGPIVRGMFWECVAVPDIRIQAANVAVGIAGRLNEEAPRWSFTI